MDLDYGYFNDMEHESLFPVDKSQYPSEGHSATPATQLGGLGPMSPVGLFNMDLSESGFEVGLSTMPQQHSAPLQTVTTSGYSTTLEAELEINCSINNTYQGSLREVQKPQPVEEMKSAQETQAPSENMQPASAEPTPSSPARNPEAQAECTEMPMTLSSSTSSCPGGEQSTPTAAQSSPLASPRQLDLTVTTKEKKEHKKKHKKDKDRKEKEREDKDQGKNHVKLQRGGKNRLKWTPELIELFHKAVKKLGAGAVPSAILEEMNVKGLTRENVASHLQKYRLQNKRLPRRDSSDDILYPEEKEQLKNMAAMEYMHHAMMYPPHLMGHPGLPHAYPMLAHHRGELPARYPYPPPHHPGPYHGPPMPHHLQRRYSVPVGPSPHMMSPHSPMMMPSSSPPPPPMSQGPMSHSQPSSPIGSNGTPPSPPPMCSPPSPGGAQSNPPGHPPQHGNAPPGAPPTFFCCNCSRRFSLPGQLDDPRDPRFVPPQQKFDA